MKKVLLVGEAMGLFAAQEIGTIETARTFYKSVSGAELNVAIGLKRLGHEPYYVTKLGNDVLGKYILDYIEKEGINTQYISFEEEYQTGIQLKSKVLNGDAYAPYFRKFSAASTMSPEDLTSLDISKFDHLHVTGISLAISPSFRNTIYTLIEKANEHNITVSFDPNIRLDMWKNEDEMRAIINDIAFKSDYFLPGISEAQILTDLSTVEAISKFYLKSKRMKAIIIKQGEQGTYYKTRFEEKEVPSFEVSQIVDTVGAGDGFAAGFIASILNGNNIEESVVYANAVGAMQLRHWSDNQGLPSHQEVLKFIAKN